MKYLILTGDENSHSNQRLKAEFELLGHEAEIKNPMRFVPFISDVSGHDRLYYRTDEGKSERLIAKNYQGVVTRVGGSVFDYAMYVLRHFENLGIFVSCPAFAAENCTDKFRTSQLLSRAKVPVPRQNLSWYAENPGELIDQVDKQLPIWVKQIKGSKGVGVFMLSEPVSANQIMESFKKIPLVIQKDVNKHKPGKRSDIRVLCVGPETENPQIVSYERVSENKDTRSNFSIHKSGREIELSETEREDVIKAAKAVGAGVSGVDVIRDEQPDSPTKGKSFIIEVNQNLGLSGIEEVTSKNCARLIVDYVIAESGRKNPNRKFYEIATAKADNFSKNTNYSHIQNSSNMTRKQQFKQLNAEIVALKEQVSIMQQMREQKELEAFSQELAADPHNRLSSDMERVREEYSDVPFHRI